MPLRREDRHVKCPFYKKTSPNKIVCEGLAEGTTIHFVFANDDERRRYMSSICENLRVYGVCPICNMLRRACDELDE